MMRVLAALLVPAACPALARLRTVLPRARQSRAPDLDLIDLAAGDVMRALVHARRSVCALAAELAGLETESRELLALAARLRSSE